MHPNAPLFNRRLQHSLSPSDDKENVPPKGATHRQFRCPPPLRDAQLDATRVPLARIDASPVPSVVDSRQKSREVATLELPREIDMRRVEQREKQINFGFNTDGYKNMLRLVEHDPRLKSGGVLPLPPPPPHIGISKRTWDMLIRKWRRGLHMFDCVFVDGEDNEVTTHEAVIEQQRLKWVNPVFHAIDPITSAIVTGSRVKRTVDEILAKRHSPLVPTKVPAEESLKHLLRSTACYEPVSSVIPDSVLYQNKNFKFSPTDVGIKIVILPNSVSGDEPLPNSPSTDSSERAPSTVARNACPVGQRLATEFSPSPFQDRFAGAASQNETRTSKKQLQAASPDVPQPSTVDHLWIVNDSPTSPNKDSTRRPFSKTSVKLESRFQAAGSLSPFVPAREY